MIHSAFNEFAYYIAANGDTVKLLGQHVRSNSDEECAWCGKVWPCNMRQVAECALAVEERRRLWWADAEPIERPKFGDPRLRPLSPLPATATCPERRTSTSTGNANRR